MHNRCTQASCRVLHCAQLFASRQFVTRSNQNSSCCKQKELCIPLWILVRMYSNRLTAVTGYSSPVIPTRTMLTANMMPSSDSSSAQLWCCHHRQVNSVRAWCCTQFSVCSKDLLCHLWKCAPCPQHFDRMCISLMRMRLRT